MIDNDIQIKPKQMVLLLYECVILVFTVMHVSLKLKRVLSTKIEGFPVVKISVQVMAPALDTTTSAAA